AGSCSFDEGFSTCNYQHDLNGDFDWTHINTKAVPYVSPDLPQALFEYVKDRNMSQGKASSLLLNQVCARSDAHILCASVLIIKSDGSGQGVQSNVMVKVNRAQPANPIWNVTSFTGKNWLKAELAVSTFWPNEYQVLFEASVSKSKAGFIAIDNVQVLSYPCGPLPSLPLHLLSPEISLCCKRKKITPHVQLWSEEVFEKELVLALHCDSIHSSSCSSARTLVCEVTSQDQDLFRCVTQSELGSGVSNFAHLFVKGPDKPFTIDDLFCFSVSYISNWKIGQTIIKLGSIIFLHVAYRMTSGSWTETHAVNTVTYKLWHLDPDTEYEIRVLLTRPGEGGTGKPGPPLITRTKCAEPMRTPKRLKIARTMSRLIAVDWESLGYNITRCHTFNVTICYQYTTANKIFLFNKFFSTAPRHLVENLPPYTNVSLKLILINPEGRKESDDTIVQTDEDVPGPVPSQSLRAFPSEDSILLYWKKPSEPNGIIIQYEISYCGLHSFDPSFPLDQSVLTVSLPSNATNHTFSQLHPGVTYELSIRASTSKGFGQAVTLNITTNISAPTIEKYDGSEAFLNETETTITVLVKPAQAKGAPISNYYIVVDKENQQRRRRQAPSDCYTVPFSYSDASKSGSNYYFAANLCPENILEPIPFTVGDNKTYQGFWNPPLALRKTYNIYLQAVSSTTKESKRHCLKLASKVNPWAAATHTQMQSECFEMLVGATEEPNFVPDPAKQTNPTMKITGICLSVIVPILLVALTVFLVKKSNRKLARKRQDVIRTTGQEMTDLGNSTDRSYAERSTLHREDPMAVTFVETHTYNNRYENHGGSAAENSHLLDIARYHCEGTESPYQTGQLHPAIRVADLLQHINLMKTSDSYGFKEEYESLFEGQSASWDVAKKEQNRTKNRYGNIIAYDHSRVILQPIENDPSSDYINANYIDGYQRPSHYIATQGPVHETVYDFWRMVWQEQSACIVMVTNLVEVGRVKCFKYWPEDAELYGDFKVTYLETEHLAEYVVRTFTLERRGFNEMREVKQFHFTGWPDHGVPYHATGLLSFIRRVKISNPPSAGPIVVHCSAGAGRTGCFIVIDIMLDMAEREGVVDIYNCVKALRSRRINMVQTEEQYIFIHDAILEACLCGETAISICEFKAAFYELIRIDSQTNSSHLKDEFQTLNSVTPQPQPEDCSIALLPRNQDKNRFMSGLPPDRCLPFLLTMDGESSNYINAALMDSYRQPAEFIVTQHPLPNTVKDFWRLVYDYGCASLVMLNEIDLAQGCPQYWPEEGMLCYGHMQVDCISSSMDCDIISRLFRVHNVTRPQEGYLMVRQFQYLGWAGHRDVPASKRSFLKLILQVDQWQREVEEEGEGRTIVHCLNGGGRSGVFCASSIVCEMSKRQSVVDIFHAVKTLRNSKPNMVDTPEQYRFCYDLALEFIESS
uniref:protein-tyrosine-phosphatase n=1 Tax=Tetraodon nigroviridis TaxID=99883 RepID=H3BWJ5_TETNG